MGGKSRKSGGVSKALVAKITKQKSVSKSAENTKELTQQANHHYQQANEAWLGALGHARQCGEALLKIKETVEHGCWKQWVEDKFDGTYATAKVYMQVARRWDEPCLVEARKNGIPINSIKSFLDVYQGHSTPEPKETPSAHDKAVDKFPCDIRKKFNKSISSGLRDMEAEELEFLDVNFDHFWNEFIGAFCKAWDKEVQRRARQNVRKAVNNKRSSAKNRKISA